MEKFADLEISLHKRESGTYSVDFRYNQPDSDSDVRLGQGNVQFDIPGLRQLSPESVEFSQALSASLFADTAVQTAFAQALASAGTLDVPLRVRLLIGQSAPELHGLHWETIRNPQDGSQLATNENILFSRYLSSLDWRPVQLRPKSALKALVVVANPSDLGEYQNLAPIDVEGEINRAKQSLGEIGTDLLAGQERPTLNNLVAQLRSGNHDILYLVCHGAVSLDEPYLWLESEDGKADITAGTELVGRLYELSQRPRLVVLASCQSAGAPTQGQALTALGPRLAQAGLPAVIAMQGNISMGTVAEFMPRFFEELLRDGQVDRAMSVARSVVQRRPDYWMPALFMRLKSGRIWYVPGFGEGRKDFEKWPALIRSIRRGQCTPILGPGLFEPLLGSEREIARRWAETYHYPMAPHERESLPQVSQYLAINQDRAFPYDELHDYLVGEIQARYAGSLPVNLRQGRPSLDKLIEAVGSKWSELFAWEPYSALAQLPLPIYITTSPSSLLENALQKRGKDPQVVLCPWNEHVEQLQTVFDREAEYFPSAERPLVFHLFGRLDEPDSIVLTEDDYFDFLIGFTGNKEIIPSAIRRALADTSLLFLGFQMDDWNFRVLFRSILSQQGGGRRDRYAHIAAQIEPEEGRILEPERARRYLENYFSKGADISLFWGSAEDFMKTLLARWNESA